jgi:phasin family protein
MFTIPEQFSAATKANLDAQLAIVNAFTSKALESVEKFVELNLTAVKSSWEESSVAAKQLLAVKDPQEFFTLTAAHAQPNAEKALAYGRHLINIATNAQSELSKSTEEHVADTNRKVLAFVEEISKNAPAGSENAVALLKSAIGNANASYDQFNKTAKQAAEAIETNLNSAVTQISQATAKAAPRAATVAKKA